MLFNSIEFLIFFFITVSLYHFIPHKHRWMFLLAASYYFYMCWRPVYIVLIIISTLIDYFAARLMAFAATRVRRRMYLILSLCSNLGLLFAFKYLNFFDHSLNALFQVINIEKVIPEFHILLPVGISFYTFQTLSYTIDVYRGKQKPERHLGVFALYVSFFPQLVAGPIERSTRLIPQFYKKVRFEYREIVDGMKLMLWGLFKKIVIADRLALYVDAVYGAPIGFHGLPLILGTVFFAFQIYCDFSGYSDIAIGLARVLGFDLMKNFNRPYYAKSISEFWQRWHISLSTWFRDYLYIPLGGNRVAKWRWQLNLAIVFLVSGLWHGANWTFVIWGGLHGLFLVCSLWTASLRKKLVLFWGFSQRKNLHKFLQVCFIFILVNYAWIFFRANHLSDALYISAHLLSGLSNATMLNFVAEGFGFGLNHMLISLAALLLMESVHFVQRRHSFLGLIHRQPGLIRLFSYAFLLLCIVLFGNFSVQQFIYFQF